MGTGGNGKKSGDISEYQGPAEDFPYTSIRHLGAAQLVVAVLLEVLCIIQLVLGTTDRFVFLASAGVAAWTPVPAIASGLIGVTVSDRRYWSAQSMKLSFVVLSTLSLVVFMPIHVIVTCVITAAHYNLTSETNHGSLLPSSIDGINDERWEDTRAFIVWAYVALGLLQVFVCLVSVTVVTACAPLYQLRVRAREGRLFGANKEVTPQVRCQVKTAVSEPGYVMVNDASLPRAPASTRALSQTGGGYANSGYANGGYSTTINTPRPVHYTGAPSGSSSVFAAH